VGRHRDKARARLAAALALLAVLTLTAPAAAKDSGGTLVLTTTADFLAGDIVNLQLPPWFSPVSPDGELRLGGTAPLWVGAGAWAAPSQGNNTYTSPALGDLDGDGDLDLLVGRADGSVVAYENSGSRTAPTWTRNAAWDGPQMGAGQYAVPTLADLDADGDLDLAVGRYDGQVWAYRNVGSRSAPAWSRETAWDPPALPVSNHAAPAFGDLDLDGLADVIVGANDDQNRAYQNTGAPGAPQWTRRPEWDTPRETSRGWTELTLGDLDCDRLPELYLGDSRGGISVYHNDGSAAGPVWTLRTAWNPPQTAAYAAPALGNLDDDRDLDLMVGARKGTLDVIRNDDAGSTAPGVWTSPALDAGAAGQVWTTVETATREVGSGGALTLSARAAATPEELAAAGWQEVPAGELPVALMQRFLQVRATFTTSDPLATVVLESLTLRSAAPLGGLAVTGTRSWRGFVWLAWSPPAGSPASYDVVRNGGAATATTTEPAYRDQPGRSAWRAGGVSYTVLARDAGGRVLAVGRLDVTLP